jgi:hypothetical protein
MKYGTTESPLYGKLTVATPINTQTQQPTAEVVSEFLAIIHSTVTLKK